MTRHTAPSASPPSSPKQRPRQLSTPADVAATPDADTLGAAFAQATPDAVLAVRSTRLTSCTRPASLQALRTAAAKPGPAGAASRALLRADARLVRHPDPFSFSDGGAVGRRRALTQARVLAARLAAQGTSWGPAATRAFEGVLRLPPPPPLPPSSAASGVAATQGDTKEAVSKDV